VVIARFSGFDVMQALARARRVSDRIGIITYQEKLPSWPNSPAPSASMAQRTYATEEDARADQRPESSWHQAIVGAGLITDLAEEAGLTGVFVYSATSIRDALTMRWKWPA
jgi:propionate catabolism operon transcriptional regulator